MQPVGLEYVWDIMVVRVVWFWSGVGCRAGVDAENNTSCELCNDGRASLRPSTYLVTTPSVEVVYVCTYWCYLLMVLSVAISWWYGRLSFLMKEVSLIECRRELRSISSGPLSWVFIISCCWWWFYLDVWRRWKMFMRIYCTCSSYDHFVSKISHNPFSWLLVYFSTSKHKTNSQRTLARITILPRTIAMVSRRRSVPSMFPQGVWILSF